MEIRYVDRETGKIEIEKPPAEGLLKFLYGYSFGRRAILPLAKRKLISSIYGRLMNKSSSVRKIEKFVRKQAIDMSEYQRSLDEFSSFNDFFHRKLKANARPIEEGLVSPGDGRLLAFESVATLQSFFVKGEAFTLATFLNNRRLAKKFQDASLIILRLAPSDYHRFHFPYQGIPSPITRIKGSYYSVSPYALAKNFVRVFCNNKREYCLLETSDKGKLLIAPIGATMVGSIINTYKPNKSVAKGEEMGYFAFGGSSVVLLVDRDKWKIDADLLANTQNKMETLVRMGMQIGS